MILYPRFLKGNTNNTGQSMVPPFTSFGMKANIPKSTTNLFEELGDAKHSNNNWTKKNAGHDVYVFKY